MPPHPSARGRALIATALLASLTGACGSSSGNDTVSNDAGSKPKLAWKACDKDVRTAPPTGGAALAWECATLRVPLDHDKPKDERIDLALIRTKATSKSKRLGSLVFNFGGPGGSGVDTMPSAAPLFETLRKHYDLVSFDPRGVGRSEGVHCLDDKELDAYFAADNTPDDKAEEKSYVKNIKDFTAGCEKNSGKVLPHIGTRDAARDMDVMREALGDKKLNYFGISYGTELGGVYANEFPEKVGRAVLDSPIDPAEDTLGRSLGQTQGFQLALDNFIEDCIAQGESCPLGEDPVKAQQKVAELLQNLDSKPFPAKGKRELTESLATGGIAQALYSKDFWPLLTEALQETDDDNGRMLLALGDSLNGRNQQGQYNTLQSSFVAIGCADTNERFSLDEIKKKLPEFEKVSPVFGSFMAWSMAGCNDWPVSGDSAKPEVGAEGSQPIVVVGTTNDPATPFAGTRHMVQALGKGVGVQITREGEGHGAYTSRNACVVKAVDAYLIRGKVPDSGKSCR